jgi:hypothetical protein
MSDDIARKRNLASVLGLFGWTLIVLGVALLGWGSIRLGAGL